MKPVFRTLAISLVMALHPVDLRGSMARLEVFRFMR
jgi:hypothetical protein